MLIKALAGTGKSTIATIIVEACYETDAARDEKEAVVLLGPSRLLRDEHALGAHFTSQAGSSTGDLCTSVLWLGRAPEQGQLGTWDQQAWAKVEAILADRIGEQRLDLRRHLLIPRGEQSLIGLAPQP